MPQTDGPSTQTREKRTAGGLKARFSYLDMTFLAVAIAGVAWWSAKDKVFSAERKYWQLEAAVFQSPLPDVKVAEEKLAPDSEAYRRRYDFTTNWFTYQVPVWTAALAPYKGKPDVRYLEVGLYEGRSSIWMLENILTHPSARMTGVDPFLGPYKEKYFKNLRMSGASDKVETITGYSQVALRGLPLNSYDIIYIDGSHSQEDVLEDAVLSWRLLHPGGILIFDDYRWAGCLVSGTCDSPTDLPRTAIDRFCQCYAKHFEVVHNSYQLILRKK